MCNCLGWDIHFGRKARKGLPFRFQSQLVLRRDQFWTGMLSAHGTETDFGAFGASPRYGQIARTATFKPLRAPMIFVRVKGKGRIYAAVGSHTLISGPLHGKLLRDFDTKGKLEWVSQDLSAYIGMPLHLEISPSDEKEFEIWRIEEGSSPPPRWNRSRLPTGFVKNGHVVSVKDEVALQLRLLDGILGRMARCDRGLMLVEPPDIADWAVENYQLLGEPNLERVNELVRDFSRAESKLAAKVRRESRLAPALFEGWPVDDRLHIRGSHKALGEIIPRRFLEALMGPKPIESHSIFSSGRDVLADQVTDPAIDPFIARVYVNRIWHHLFGRGIVASVDNFGVMGERPTHPELLDYLADRFVREGWSTKRLIRELVLSRTYRMSSQGDPAADQADAQNLLLHKARLRRLEGEAIRDSMLAVSGRLDDKMYGKSVPIHLTEFIDGRGKGQSGPLDGDGRRSIYLAVKRNFLSPMLLAFDTPTPFSTMGRRTVSNVPAQR